MKSSTLALSKRHELALIKLAFGPDAKRDWQARHDAWEQDYDGQWWAIEVKGLAPAWVKQHGGIVEVAIRALEQVEKAALDLSLQHKADLVACRQEDPLCCALIHLKGGHLMKALACYRLPNGAAAVLRLADFKEHVLGFWDEGDTDG